MARFSDLLVSMRSKARPAPVAIDRQPQARHAGPAYVLVDPAEEAKPRSLISALGPPIDELGGIIEAVAASCRAGGEFPVAVLSDLRTDLIAASQVPFEFVPMRRHVPFLHADAYERYVRQRWSLILTKWNIGEEVTLGWSFEEFLTEQRGASASDPISERAIPLP